MSERDDFGRRQSLVRLASAAMRSFLTRQGWRDKRFATGVVSWTSASPRPAGYAPLALGVEEGQPGVKAALEALVDLLTRGDPMSPLRWTCKSKAKLAAALVKKGWTIVPVQGVDRLTDRRRRHGLI